MPRRRSRKASENGSGPISLELHDSIASREFGTQWKAIGEKVVSLVGLGDVTAARRLPTGSNPESQRLLLAVSGSINLSVWSRASTAI